MMGKLLLVFVLLGTVLVILISTAINIHFEKKRFNRGFCPRCGTFLRYFDTDSQGSRGYICDKCKYSTWVFYKSIDKNYIR